MLAVFSQETRDEAGGQSVCASNRRLRVVADYHTVLYPEGVGHHAGSKLTTLLGQRDHEPEPRDPAATLAGRWLSAAACL